MKLLPGTKKKKKKNPHNFNAEFKIGIQQNVIPGTYLKCTPISFCIIKFILCFIAIILLMVIVSDVSC